MAKVTGPLFGFAGAGSIGKTLTFAKWRGVSYVKRWTTPSNPQTAKQSETRDVFAMLNGMWKLSPTGLIAPWTAASKGRSFVNRNKFIGDNLKVLRAYPALATMATFVASPGAGGGPPAAVMILTPGDTQISVGLTLPETPTGWTLASSFAVAFKDQAPATAFQQEIIYNDEAVAPETNVLPGLTNDELYVVSAFLVWTKPDGTTAYSVSLSDTATPAA